MDMRRGPLETPGDACTASLLLLTFLGRSSGSNAEAILIRAPYRVQEPLVMNTKSAKLQSQAGYPSRASERHYTPNEIAESWNMSLDSIRRLFRDEPGVLKFGTVVSRPGCKRAHATLRIPESVFRRVYARMTQPE